MFDQPMSAEQALRESEARHRAMMHNIADAIVTADANGIIVEWNTAARHIFGYTESEALGQPLTLLMPQRYRQRHSTGLSRVQKGGERRAIGKIVELHGLTKTGVEFPIELSLAAWEVPEARFFTGIIRDITYRRRTELALARRTALYDMLSQCNQSVVRIRNRDELFATVCRIAVEHGHFRFAWIGLVDSDARQVLPVATYGEDAGYLQQLHIATDDSDAAVTGPVRVALDTGRHAVSNDFLGDPALAAWHEAARRAGIGATAAFPIRLRGRVIGNFSVYADMPGFFTDDLLATLDEMATDISFAIENYAVEAERAPMLEALRESERRYRMMFEANPHPMWVYDLETLCFLAVNDAAVARYGWSRAEFFAMTIADIRPADGLPRLRGTLAQALPAATHYADTWRHRTRDGSLIDVEITSHELDFGGRPARLVLAHDITERNRVEEALRESEARFRALTEMSSDFYWESDAEHRLTQRGSADKIVSTVSVFRQGAQIGQRRWEVPYLSPDEAGWQAHRALLDAHLPFRNFELSRLGADGAERHISISGDPVFGADGTFRGYRGVGSDITGRRRGEQALARESHRNKAFLHNASDGIHILDAEGNVLEVSYSFCKMLGYSREELIGANVSLWNAQWSPQELKQHIAEQLATGGQSVFETRHRRRDGSMLDVEITGQGLELDGKPVLFNSARDITERKRTGAALRAAEEQFRGLVEQSIAGTYIIQNDKLAYVNPRFAEIFGYASADELIGRESLSLVIEKERSVVLDVRRRIEAEVQNMSYGFTARRKDGSTIEVGVHGSRATHEGRPAIIGLVQDISEKKRAEEQIQRYIAQLEGAFMRTVEVATTLSEMRDPYTAGHERRVAEIAVAIGAELGFDARRQEGLRVAGYLHDIGKITIPSEILSKPGKLSRTEFELIKGHPQASYDVLKGVEFPWPVAEVALQHHERIDGSGYPQGLKGDAILFEARILSVADVIEAMSSHRPYRPGLGIDKALAEIERGRGSAYDAAVADACLKLFRDKGYAIPA